MERRTLFSFLASMPFGLILFALVAAVSSIGSFHPALGPAVYRSWWFFGLLFLLVLNTGLCAWNRRAWLLGGGLRQRVVWVLHVSVLVVAVACSWAAASFRMEQITVRRGAGFRVGAETWTLGEVEVRRYPDGSVSDWISRVQTPAGPREIKVNHPAVSGELKVLQSGFQQIYRVAIESGGRMQTVEVVQDVEVPLSADGLIGFALSPPQDGLLAKAQAESGALPFVDLLLTSRGRVLQRTSLFVGVPLALGDTGLGLTVLAADQESVFLLRNAPGLPFVWGGFALLAASVTALALIPRSGAPKEKEIDA
jgi:hypothetical protein